MDKGYFCSLNDWFVSQQQNGHKVYALVDVLSFPDVLTEYDYASYHAPLLSADSVANADEIAWAFGIEAHHLSWWEQHKQCGILVSGSNQVLAHFASLFMASLNGEHVFFPMYSVPYILPMLNHFQQDEVDSWLGTAYSCLICDDGRFKGFDNTSPRTEIKTTPWWRIQEHHINQDISLDSVRLWLWTHFDYAISYCVESGRSVDEIFERHLNMTEKKPFALFDAVIEICGARNVEVLRDKLHTEELFVVLHELKDMK